MVLTPITCRSDFVTLRMVDSSSTRSTFSPSSCCVNWLATGCMRSLQCVGGEFPARKTDHHFLVLAGNGVLKFDRSIAAGLAGADRPAFEAGVAHRRIGPDRPHGER